MGVAWVVACVGRDDDFSSSMGDNGFRAFTPEPMSDEQLQAVQTGVAAIPDTSEEKILELADEELQDVAGGASVGRKTKHVAVG